MRKILGLVMIAAIWAAWFSGNDLLQGVIALVVTLYLLGGFKWLKVK